jgi:hypothetical protein
MSEIILFSQYNYNKSTEFVKHRDLKSFNYLFCESKYFAKVLMLSAFRK